MFTIPSGTLVSVCRADDEDRQWQAHRTQRELRFERECRTAECYGEGQAVIFQEGQWLILTKRTARDSGSEA